jgi:Zn-dependent metalloprotease
MKRTVRIGLGMLAAAAIAGAAAAQPRAARPHDAEAVRQLTAETGAAAELSDATGTVRFARLAARGAAQERGAQRRLSAQERQAHAMAFLKRHGRAFGLANADTDLALVSSAADAQGRAHLVFVQRYRGLPVFGATLRVHFDQADALSTVNGLIVPDIALDATPSRTVAQAGRTARESVRHATGDDSVSVSSARLLVFRAGLAKGVPGDNHLAWEIEVGNGITTREFVYVDAHTGKIIDQITGIFDGLNRRAYNAQGATAPGPNYPGNPFWVEGQPFPTGTAEADNMIAASKDIYDVFWLAFGRDAFDANGAIMDSIFNRGNGCPNASWNGLFISFCPGTTSDDVTAHEWGHAYTQYTHNLIYQWQPGALNESYSDIWGEVIDLLNGRGTDTPGGLRTAGACTTFTSLRPSVTINAPPAIAGIKLAGTAAFGPQSFNLTNDVVLANDGFTGSGSTLSDGCCGDGPNFECNPNSWPNAAQVAGKIALVDRGTCGFVVKAKNAQLQGAIGIIVANNAAGIINMGGVDATVVIPALSILQTDGVAIKAQLLSTTVNATLTRGGTGTDNSVRWLMGEDATAFGGAIRDMWNPPCYANPGKVTDTAYYVCSTADAGGVHTNSGIPNHAFALIADGGTYNGRSVAGIGLTKAAHIYYRAQTVYQGPASNFADHADAIEASCADLMGVNLTSLTTGLPSGEIINASDCQQVAEAAAAVELRTPPTFCNFQPMLAKNPPPRCATGTTQVNHFLADFESAPTAWTVSHVGSTPDFTPRDWVWTHSLPDRAGSGFFGIDPDIGTCAPGGDESGVLFLTSPSIPVPSLDTFLTFDHWVATEALWDGGNLKISVNGGPFQLVAQGDYIYNGYNANLNTAAAGNTNPLAGQRAFTGADGGSVEGSWGRSHVRLTNYAPAGSNIRLRWEMGTDGCAGVFGWYVDDVTVYACASNTPPRLAGRVTGTSGRTVVTLEVENTGGATAHDVTLTQLVPKVMGGSGTITVATPLPIALGTMAPGEKRTVIITLDVPLTVTRFSLTENGTYREGAGITRSFSMIQILVP